MVATRRNMNGNAPEQDENRMIALVTGANSGFGQGICNLLLRSLSLPPGSPIPASTPHLPAIPFELQALLPGPEDPFTDEKKVPRGPPPTLTLILAVRSRRNGDAAREQILAVHEKELEARRRRGLPVREGWRDGLQLVVETVDLDSVGGDHGVLQFCERIRNAYPHLTSMFLNAGIHDCIRNDYWLLMKQVLRDGPAYAFSRPEFLVEKQGSLSADGERGKVWGINVLANYLFVKELVPLLRKSPRGLPFPPRVVYTSSSTAEKRQLNSGDIWDYELVSWSHTYSPSKYIGDLVMAQLDRQLDVGEAQARRSSERSIRCFSADPGCLQTGIVASVFGTWAIYVAIMTFFYRWTFALTRIIFGSEDHPIDSTDGSIGMVYAALVDEKYLLPASKVPGPKFLTTSHRWSASTVRYREVDHWQDSERIAEDQLKHCETLRRQWRRREGLE